MAEYPKERDEARMSTKVCVKRTNNLVLEAVKAL